MTEPDVKGTWKVLSSSSRFFPIGAEFKLQPKEGEPDSFELDVIWEKHDPIRLVERDFRRFDNSTVEGRFNHPKDPHEGFQLVVTRCLVPGPGGGRLLFGLLNGGRIEGGGTGVWVAEGPPTEPPQE